jgi:hypothetical protein
MIGWIMPSLIPFGELSLLTISGRRSRLRRQSGSSCHRLALPVLTAVPTGED